MGSIDPAALRVVDLKVELSNRGLPTKGKKDELVARLTEALEEEKNDNESSTEKSSSSEENVETQQEEQVAEKPVEDFVKKTEEPVAEKPAEEVAEKPVEEQVIEKPVEAVIEKPKEQAVAKPKEQVVEESKEAVIETPMEEVIQESKEEVIEKPKEEVVEKPKEKVIKKPKEEVIAKESMDADRLKRRRSEDAVDVQEEKRPRVETEKKEVKSDKIESSAFYVKGFVRPLIIRSAQELFSRYGTVKRFWMDPIKTHCYVIYETDAEAKKAFDNINGLVFPEDTGKALSVGGLTPEQAESLIQHESAAAERRLRVDWEPLIQKVKNGESLPPSPGSDNLRKARSIGMGQIAKQLAQAAEPAPSISRHDNIEKPREPRELSLDDLFRKTKATPVLYYLPNTDIVAKEKLKAIQNL